MNRSPAALSRIVSVLALCAVFAVLAASALLIVFVRGHGAAQLWHKQRLTEEFTAGNADEVVTFADYRQLEDRLFAELDTKIYDRTPTGPAYALVRYSRGSAADPHRRDGDWNRSFELAASSPRGAVLLLHGMSDSPYSQRALGLALNRNGYHVLGLRLPGHGTAPSGMKTASWEDMAAAVRLAMRHLATRAGEGEVHIIGYSTGAPLALDYALDAREGRSAPLPASLVLISPAIGITRAAWATRWLDMLAAVPGLEGLAWTQILPEFDPYKYNSFTSNASYQVLRLTRSVARRLQAAASSQPLAAFPPTLVFLSAVDATVSADAVIDVLFEHLAPGRNELVLFDVNRQSVSSSVMIADPGPLTARLMASRALPFALTLVANEDPQLAAVVSRHKPALSTDVTTEPLQLAWPFGIISLSHIALPFPPDDPLYGRGPPPAPDLVFLGQIPVQGERGLLLFPADWLLRLRHNPFFAFLEKRTLEWLEQADGAPAAAAEERAGEPH
jgi:alpha-beta hydrolase superfamily lysophospholipase